MLSTREKSTAFSCQNNESLDRYKHKQSFLEFLRAPCDACEMHLEHHIQNTMESIRVETTARRNHRLNGRMFPRVSCPFSSRTVFVVFVHSKRRCSVKHPEKQDACALRNGERRLSRNESSTSFPTWWTERCNYEFQLVCSTALIKRGSLGRSLREIDSLRVNLIRRVAKLSESRSRNFYG